METPSTETLAYIPNNKHLFWPQDVCHHPCDVTLVVEDEKKFQAHRKVLAEASQFFEKLLSCDMRESKEGVVRLEMPQQAMFLLRLKSLAGRAFSQKLN